MLTYNGKEYRNLEEQVRKNQTDIIKIIESSEIINDYGLRIVGSVDDVSELPDPQTYTGSYGDCYTVGTESDYNIYIFTRPTNGEQYPTWFNLGRFPSPGPQGPQGPVGPSGAQGERGSKWSSSASNPAINNNLKGDQHLNTNDGSVFQFDGSAWYRTGSLRGPQGIQGPVGPQGAQGVQGPKGDTGAQGPVGPGFEVVGIVASTDLLPDPSTLPDNEAYLVGTDEAGYDLYVQVNNVWVDSGKVSGIEGPQGPAGPQGPQGPQGEQGPIGATGPQGEKGDAATIAIGTVITVNSSQPAKVTNSGTTQNAIFNFEIPKGLDGRSGNYEWINGNTATNEQKQACLLCDIVCSGQFTYEGITYDTSIVGFTYFEEGKQSSLSSISFGYNMDDGIKVLTNVQVVFNFYLNSSGEIAITLHKCTLLDKNMQLIDLENPTISIRSILTIA